ELQVHPGAAVSDRAVRSRCVKGARPLSRQFSAKRRRRYKQHHQDSFHKPSSPCLSAAIGSMAGAAHKLKGCGAKVKVALSSSLSRPSHSDNILDWPYVAVRRVRPL